MDQNILYSFRRCPYAIRARWALINTHQEVILREVNLKNKSLEFLSHSKKGTVPILITGKKVIEESLDIMIWAIEKSNKSYLLGVNNSNMKATIFELINQNDTAFKYHLDRYKYSSRYCKSKKEEHKSMALKILYSLNNRIKYTSRFLVDEHETLADWAIWPFVRQFRLADKLSFDNNNKLENLNQWLNYYLSHNNFDFIMRKYKVWETKDKPIFFG